MIQKTIQNCWRKKALIFWLLAALGSYAHAEGSTFSVTGTARFGDGAMISTFPATPGATEYALRLSSGLFISSGPIRFQDGTFQFSGAGTASTSTVIPEQIIDAKSASWSRCVEGSTVSLTLSSDSHLGIFFSGSARDAVYGNMNVLLDGDYLFERRTTLSCIWDDEYSSVNMSFFVVPGFKLSKGQHSLCLLLIPVLGDSVMLISNSSTKALFGAFEIR